jgi:choline dehydrogenase-like flavoprotein
MKLKNSSNVSIYSKGKKSYAIFKNIHKKIFKFLCNEKLIYPIYKNFLSNHGSAYHYFGTIPISKNKSKMSVNDFCQLKNYKNIFIIDGSVFDFKINKYPLGLVMANARRVAKEIKNINKYS